MGRRDGAHRESFDLLRSLVGCYSSERGSRRLSKGGESAEERERVEGEKQRTMFPVDSISVLVRI
jgi:hypothetical protein